MLLPGLLYALLNIGSASSIVFANKAVFLLGWDFTCTLTLVHTLFTLAGLRAFVAMGVFKPRQPPVPTVRVAPLSLAFVAYIVLCNWNLNMNTVGFYQV